MCDKSKIGCQQIIETLNSAGLLKEIHLAIPDLTFNKFAVDSRKIEPNDVFICIKGYETDGHLFAEAAGKKGAELFVTQKKLNINKPQIVVSDSRKAAAILAKLYYNDPTSKFKLIGITGTNGKTTIAHILHQILLNNDIPAGLIGTMGYKINSVSASTLRTTPDIFDLNKIFSEMVEKKIQYVIMEVSSHALALHRVFGCKFDLAIFTNLSQDHLDFHSDMSSYANAKFELFKLLSPESGKAIINIDDEHGKRFFEKLQQAKKSISFQSGDYHISKHQTGLQGSRFRFTKDNIDFVIKTKLIGKFNIFNVAAAVAASLELEIPISKDRLITTIPEIENVEGRMQSVPNAKGIGIFVDYAHTPNALQNVLSALKEFSEKRLICVFGAGGNRDTDKRPKMLAAVLQQADLAIITNDNPRWEDAAKIIRNIVSKTDPMEKFWIVRDRKAAIETAVNTVRKGDILLIAGKGHETYQEINGIKIHFDDREIAAAALIKQNDGRLSFPIDPLMLHVIFSQSSNPQKEQPIYHISTDSRSIKPNSLFFALQGEKFDGHDYVEKVLQNKNCWAVVRSDFESTHPNLLRVDDPLTAYGKLAARYKTLFKLETIGITGSSGKTTTKEYLVNIISQKLNVHKTLGNENNLIGLPKTIFNLQAEHEIAILELGTNQFGEIDKLTDIATPDLAVITSIGPSHLEFLIDENGVFREKTAIFKMPKSKKFFPGDDVRFSEYKGITFGRNPENDYVLSNIKVVSDSTEFDVNDIKYSIPTPFSTFCINALIAIAICTELDFETKEIQSGLKIPLNISNRMQILKSGKRTILADCYNANPDSMQAALQFWLAYDPNKAHVAVLGDMLELGELTEKYHRNILHLLEGEEIEQLISVGNLSRNYKADRHFRTVEELLQSKTLNNLPTDAVILVKASHSIALEKILGRL